MRTDDLQLLEPPMSILGMFMPGAVVVGLVVGLSVVLVAEVVATGVVIMSITIVMVFLAGQNE